MLTSVIIFLIASLLIALITFIIYKNINPKKYQYELVTTGNKGLFIFGLFFAIVGAGVMILMGVGNLTFLSSEQDVTVLVSILGGLFSILGVLVIADLTFGREAIDGNEIIIKRFYTKEKRIPISDIANILPAGNQGFVFVNKMGKRIFTMSFGTGKMQEFMNLVNERRKNPIGNIEILSTNKNNTIEESEELLKKYEIIGKDYKSRGKSRLVNQIMASTYPALIDLVFVTCFFILGQNIVAYIFLGLSAVSLAIIIPSIIKRNKNLSKEMRENSDVDIGRKYYASSPIVNGTNMTAQKNKIFILIIFPVILAFVSVIFLRRTVTYVPYEQSELTQVTGHLEYFSGGKGSILNFGLKETKTEYRLSQTDGKYFDYSFKNEIHEGDLITILINPNVEDKEFSRKGVEKTLYNYAYMIKSSEKTYFDYGDYIKAFNDTKASSFVISASSAVGVVGCIALIVSSKKTYEKNKAKAITL